MKMKLPFAPSNTRRKTALAALPVALATLLVAMPAIRAERGSPPRAAAPRAAAVDRTNHGSVRHAETQVVRRPVAVRPEPGHTAEVRHEEVSRGNVRVHRDVEADFHRHHFWNDFAFGRRLGALPLGFLSLELGGLPYFYSDGIYYQAADGGYAEVYPPIGAIIPQAPDGALEVEAGGQTYYYAGGAFYAEQPDGTYAIAPTPIGVVVPELPPGALAVTVKGATAYQFNGIYYEPTFVSGVTQYETFTP
jgi:hypothetical protein